MSDGGTPDDSWSALRAALDVAPRAGSERGRRVRLRSRTPAALPPVPRRAGPAHLSAANPSPDLPEVAEVSPIATAATPPGDGRYRALLQHSTDLVVLLAEDGTIAYQTPSVEHVLGIDGAGLRGRRFEELLHPDDAPRATAFLLRARRQRVISSPVEWRLRGGDGSWVTVETVCKNLLDEADVRGLLLTSRDVGTRRAVEAQLEHQATHDPLTDLANRALIKQRIEEAYLGGGGHFALLFIDLDNFKNVNDSLGHAVGDELLAAVAARVRSCLRPHDTPARLGGDEFAILLGDADGVEAAIAVAERIRDDLQAPFSLGGRRAFVQASIGIAGSDSARDAGELLRNADIAMYRAKVTSKGTCAVFLPEMHGEAAKRLELESDLRAAVLRDELKLHYQPIIALASGRITGIEALLRWEHPRRGLLHPSSFMGIAEETGLIQPIGRWVLTRAIEQLGRWRRAVPAAGPLSVSVNLSARQLDDAGLVGLIDDAIRGSGLEPHALMLEITETAMMRDTAAAARRLGELKQLGLRLALDDFGTGYSSLHYLHCFPISLVKVAKPFVDALGEGSAHAVFTQSIVDLCRTLGLAALAEGVESGEQAQALRALRCDFAQGFFLSEPLPVGGIDALLAHGHTLDHYATQVLGRSPVSDARWWMKVTGQRGHLRSIPGALDSRS